jgi:predicted RNA-binding Zn ribbon-like protein
VSLQDDYYELDASLKGWKKTALNRIWDAFCEMEAEYDKLTEIKRHLREAVRLTFEDEKAADAAEQKEEAG